MKKINIGILGFGVVGQGTAQLIQEKNQEIQERSGIELCIKKICDRNIPKNPSFGLSSDIFTKNSDELLADDIDIVVELIGGVDFAKDFTLKAIENGKHVVSANKHLYAVHGEELITKAQEKEVMLLIEASVCGAIPCLRTLRSSSYPLKINKIKGILNGTANFILSKLQHKGGSFAEVLKEAQDLGYAEADPTFDIEGIDSAHKITLLSVFAFGAKSDFNAVYTKGISSLIPDDFAFAKKLGYKIKLVGSTELKNGKIYMSIMPTFVQKYSKLGQIDNAMNAVVIESDESGPILLEGYGAGGIPTGSAVVSDITEIALSIVNSGSKQFLPFKVLHKTEMGDFLNLPKKTVLRVIVNDAVGVFAKISTTLAEENISILGASQEPNEDKVVAVSLILDTAPIHNVLKAAKKIEDFSFSKKEPLIFPIDERA